ncbi:hypothetical protein KBC70_02110 [Candidatus Woesebacteria bacterium]|nr:hypothetical protein [Candidatus Woesebacteria bacterium]
MKNHIIVGTSEYAVRAHDTINGSGSVILSFCRIFPTIPWKAIVDAKVRRKKTNVLMNELDTTSGSSDRVLTIDAYKKYSVAIVRRTYTCPISGFAEMLRIVL